MTHRTHEAVPPTRTIRVKSPADLLALVPSLFGFHPERSLVLMTVGRAGRPFHARVDLPPNDPDEVVALVDHLVQVVGTNRADRVAILAYTDDAALTTAILDAFAPRLLRAGAQIAVAARADGTRWWLRREGRRERGPGTPYDVRSHPLMAAAVMEGTVVLGSRQELADSLVGHDEEEREEVGRLADEVVAGLARVLDSPLGEVAGQVAGRRHLVAEGRWVRDTVRGCVATGRRLDPSDLARLVVAMTVSLEIRDVAWAEMDHDNARGHVALWQDVVRRVPADLRAAPAALLGFAAWLTGHGALAWCAVDCAQRAQPGYGLAGILADALAGAVPPSTWTPPGPEEVTLLDDR